MLIDIRSPEQYQKDHLEGAVSIPFFSLQLHPEKYLQKGKTYTLYCDTGNKSSLLVSYLKRIGYSVVNLEGGYLFHAKNYTIMNTKVK